MVTCQLARFRHLQRRLLERIDEYDTPEFQALDREAADTFEAILQLSPANADDIRALISFLLDMIAGSEECGSGRLIERVRELTGFLAACAEIPHRFEHGTGAGI
ncbi:superfamily I DNA/RNA helicase [Mycoplana sp. BE70]|uniref:hypothetical protein n=1 Tax=Mycoplana sp. BE70 TaxID=2817775 RepID=UPI00285AE5A7|nr:hypothetical protein [Mycoplana sp. BE70]MDR6757683.1 superfamily I DNA/RNA helicase [Mycoplana sp. BE70]